MLATSADDPSLAGARVIIKVKGHQYRRLAWWLRPVNRTFLEVASMVVTWWIVAFLYSGSLHGPWNRLLVFTSTNETDRCYMRFHLCMFVCVSVLRITQDVMSGFS